METISKQLYYKEYESPIAYGYKEEHKVKSYVKIMVHFDFKEWLRFSVSSPNFGCCYRNPFKVLLIVLEHESICMAKYQRLKDDCRNQDKWRSLDPDYKRKG